MKDSYDVYVSSSVEDEQWVSERLLKRLADAGLSVCDYAEEFDVGLGRALLRSSKIIVVMTPNWVEQSWPFFESTMVSMDDPDEIRRKLILIRLAHCNVPPRLSTMTYLDCATRDLWEDSIRQVLSILGVRSPQVTTAGQINTMIPGQDERVNLLVNQEIFISHSSKDKPLAQSLVKLLQLGLGVGRERIFCSSLAGMDIPAGKDFKEHIKLKLGVAKTVIVMASENYFDSPFCLCELGATWALSNDLFPLLIPPLSYDDAKVVLRELQIEQINASNGLNKLKDRLVNQLRLNTPDTTGWEDSRNDFLGGLASVLEKLPKPMRILQTEHEDMLREVAALRLQIEDLKKHALSNTSGVDVNGAQIVTVSPVAAVQKDDTLTSDLPIPQTEENVFDSTEGEARVFLNVIGDIAADFAKVRSGTSNLIKKAFFLSHCRLAFWLPDDGDGTSIGEAVYRAQQYRYVYVDERGLVTLNTSEKLIGRLSTRFLTLDGLVERASERFREAYADEHDCYPDLRNRAFWETHFALPERY
ncbi:MAG TPA: toll/interleukin-1 receptor domain-containing protein [bacterium]|jgi:hypothetical protein